MLFLTTHLMTGMFNQKLNGYTTVTGKPISKYVFVLCWENPAQPPCRQLDDWLYSPQLVSGVWVGYDQE